ncbi:MAG: hypothetical protein ACOYXM_09815 [Actinomycetota bacterium]
MKAAVVVLSDPAGGDEALGRAFNALAAVKDYAEQGADVTVLFQGAGTRWLAALAASDHPLHGLFEHARPHIAGASDACSTFFSAREGVEGAQVGFVAENEIAGVGGLPSLATLSRSGYEVLLF